VGRLSEGAQDAVRVAAVAGREFDFDLLKGAWGKGEEATLAALDELLRHRLVGEAAAGVDYVFTHHKIQEVVYEGLPRHRRLHLHGQVGTAMERWLGAEAGTRAVELAYHFEQARQLDGRLTDKALSYLLVAGRQAERGSANREALAYYARGLDILQTLPETPQRLQQEIDLQMAMAVPTTVIHGYASPETRQVYDRAGELCRELGSTPAAFSALAGLSRHRGVSGDMQKGLELGEQMLAIARAAQETDWLLESYRAMAGPLFSLGRLHEARAFCEQGAALYNPAEHERHAYRFGHDPAAMFYGYLSLTLWLLGYPDRASAQDRRLRELMQSWSHPTSLAYAHCFLALAACLRRDAQGAGREAEQAIRLGQTHVLPSWTAMATALQGWSLVEQGRAEGLAQLNEGISVWRARGFEHLTPVFLALQAEAFLKGRQPAEGRAALAEARALTKNGVDLYCQAEVYRLLGELLQAEGRDANEAEIHFRQALETARGQEARMLELRAAVSLARLWEQQGKKQVARELLAEIYGRFDEGFDTPDLLAAAALLSALM
jgi:tetratricopeptide (TPR) repeat protein